jgi:hypothetical protein
MLWQRSLVMQDLETESLWSHLLGEAMRGEMRGAQLEQLVGDMVTWDAWRREHPETTVLNLPRTHRAYTRDFYRDPAAFVLGFEVDGDTYHCSFSTLMERPLIGFDVSGSPLLLCFDRQSTSARLFSRIVDHRELTFLPVDANTMRDEQTGSRWNRKSGVGKDGELVGKQLAQLPGIVSFARAWRVFHPESAEVASDD